MFFSYMKVYAVCDSYGSWSLILGFWCSKVYFVHSVLKQGMVKYSSEFSLFKHFYIIIQHLGWMEKSLALSPCTIKGQQKLAVNIRGGQLQNQVNVTMVYNNIQIEAPDLVIRLLIRIIIYNVLLYITRLADIPWILKITIFKI